VHGKRIFSNQLTQGCHRGMLLFGQNPCGYDNFKTKKIMNRNLKLTVSENIDAPAAVVWNALTDSETISKFMWGTHAKSDWKVGSPLTFEGVWEGKAYHEKGTILEIQKDKLMKYSYLTAGIEDVPENYSIITYQLSSDNGTTKMTVTQEGATDEKSLEHSKQGWTSILGNLKNVVEKKIPAHK
jgi:uncharacterized protein YndB with AHSA1/START domain